MEDCLQWFILKYFGESEVEVCGVCGNCIDIRIVYDVIKEVQMVLLCIIRMNECFGKMMVVQVFNGLKNKKVLENGFSSLFIYGIMKY